MSHGFDCPSCVQLSLWVLSLLACTCAGSIEIHDSSFTNIAIGKDFPLLTFTSGETPCINAAIDNNQDFEPAASTASARAVLD